MAKSSKLFKNWQKSLKALNDMPWEDIKFTVQKQQREMQKLVLSIQIVLVSQEVSEMIFLLEKFETNFLSY